MVRNVNLGNKTKWSHLPPKNNLSSNYSSRDESLRINLWGTLIWSHRPTLQMWVTLNCLKNLAIPRHVCKVSIYYEIFKGMPFIEKHNYSFTSIKISWNTLLPIFSIFCWWEFIFAIQNIDFQCFKNNFVIEIFDFKCMFLQSFL